MGLDTVRLIVAGCAGNKSRSSRKNKKGHLGNALGIGVRSRTVSRGSDFNIDVLDRRLLMSVSLSTVYASVNEESSRSFLVSNFAQGFSDTTGKELQSISVTTLPGHGSLTLAGSPVTANQNISAGAISTLIYAPATGYTGADSFGWNATDGATYASNPAAVDVTVTQLPHLNISNASVVKGSTGTSNMVFTVTRSGDLSTPFAVNYNTTNGTAVAGTDYNSTTGTLSFSQGQTIAAVSVPITGNTRSNPNLTFNVHLYNASVNSLFSSQTSLTVGTFPSSIVASDFNGDGKIDLAVVNYIDGTVSVLMGNGDGTFLPAVNYTTGTVPVSIAAGDFNNDGKIDLVVTNEGNNTVGVLLGNGNGTFKPEVEYSAGLFPYGIAVADFSGDGILDLAVADNENGEVSILSGNGDGTFQSPQTYSVGLYPISIVTGDFTGNGKQDLAVTNFGSASVSVLMGNGNGTFQTAQTYSVGSGPDFITTGDFNGDGILDLAVADRLSDNVDVLLGNSNGTFQSPVSYPVGNSPYAVTAGDVYSNGKLDLIVANSDDGTLSILQGNGNGTFQPATTAPANSSPQAVVAADFNNDGRLDVAAVNYYSGTVTALLAGSPAVVVDNATATGTIQSSQSSSGALNLNGPAFYLKLDADGVHLDVWNNTTAAGPVAQQALLSSTTSVAVTGTTGSDTLVVDYSAGDPLPASGLTDTGGGTGTNDTLKVIGSAGNDSVTASSGEILMNGVANNVTNVGKLIFTPGVGTDSLLVSSAALQLAPPSTAGITKMNFSSINISGGATVTVAAPVSVSTRSVVVTSGLVLAHTNTAYTATLNLSANDLIVHNGNLSTLTGQIKSGFNAGASYWGGTGITSSAAAGNTAYSTALGVIQNSVDGTPSAAALYSSFDGVPAVNTDVLIKYTYYGDANLSGSVDGSDYSLIDNGYLNHLSGWYNGDFNYDTSVDGSDYTLIDDAFNIQGAQLAAAVDTSPASTQTILSAKQRDDSTKPPITLLTQFSEQKISIVSKPVSNGSEGPVGRILHRLHTKARPSGPSLNDLETVMNAEL